MKKDSILFTPVTIGTMTVKNRFVRSATHDYLGHPDGSISDAEIELCHRRSKMGHNGRSENPQYRR